MTGSAPLAGGWLPKTKFQLVWSAAWAVAAARVRSAREAMVAARFMSDSLFECWLFRSETEMEERVQVIDVRSTRRWVGDFA